MCGVDVGAVLNVKASSVHDRQLFPEDEDSEESEERRRNLWTGTCRTFAELRDVLKRYRIDICVIDALPETHKVQEFRDEVHEDPTMNTQIYLCRFHPTPRVSSQKYGMRINRDSYAVTGDRTAVLDVTFGDLRQGRVELPSDIMQVPHFSDQMRAPVRVLSPKGDRYIWDEGAAADHYRFADAYERIAMDLLVHAGGYIEFDLD